MTGIIKTDKLQSSAGNDALTIASNGGLTIGNATNTAATFSASTNSQNADIVKISATGTSSSANLKFNVASGAQAQIRLGGNDDISIHNTSSDTERLRILAAGGLTFNGDTAAANALDDYEEGTWTPADNSGASMSLTVWEAFYTKIGRKVYIEIGFLIPSNSSSAVVRISGLPFAAKDGNDNTGGFTLVGSNSGRLDYWLVTRGQSRFGCSTFNNVGAPNSSYSNKQIKLNGSYTVA